MRTTLPKHPRRGCTVLVPRCSPCCRGRATNSDAQRLRRREGQRPAARPQRVSASPPPAVVLPEQGRDLSDGLLCGRSPSPRGTRGRRDVSLAAAPSPVAQSPGSAASAAPWERGEQAAVVPEPGLLPGDCRHRRRQSSSRLSAPGPFLQEVSLFIPLSPLLLAKRLPSGGQSGSGTAEPWALPSLDAALRSQEPRPWPDMKGEVLTSRFLQAA